MQKPNILRKQYTLNEKNYQLKSPMEMDACSPDNDPVRLISQFVEEMDLAALYDTYERMPSEKYVSPEIMLKIMLYAYHEGKEISSRTGSLTPGIKNQICLRLSPIEKWAFFMKKSCQFFKIYIASFCVLCYNIVIYAYPEVPHESQNQQVQTRSSLLHH